MGDIQRISLGEHKDSGFAGTISSTLVEASPTFGFLPRGQCSTIATDIQTRHKRISLSKTFLVTGIMHIYQALF